MYREHQFVTPATVLRLILIMGSLSIIFKTFRETTQLYPKESGKRLMDTKNYKNGNQLLCENSDPLDTIVLDASKGRRSSGGGSCRHDSGKSVCVKLKSSKSRGRVKYPKARHKFPAGR